MTSRDTSTGRRTCELFSRTSAVSFVTPISAVVGAVALFAVEHAPAVVALARSDRTHSAVQLVASVSAIVVAVTYKTTTDAY